ncbi:MAG: DUF1624 domain-containing protein [Gemmatimonadetes bacterium]|nr:DUF1624 domain-containing protein [Gemmatimonadota bacterium]
MTESPRTAPPSADARARIASLDIVRGLAMVLMAIDHVRVYSGQPAGGPTPGIFFTRWVTHFVAPAFVFLAGTSAWLYAERRTRGELTRFLVTRGVWLILLELTVLRVAWTFNLDYAHYMLAGVIWMIGWCMIGLAVLAYLPPRAVLAFGLVVVLGHNVMDFVPWPQSPGALASVLYYGGAIPSWDAAPHLDVLFVIVPWIAVMALGYAFGPVMRFTPERRRAFLIRLGVACVAAFLVLRGLDVYGDPHHWRAMRTATQYRPSFPAPLAFLNTNKYPASLLFLLMTLGPMFLALAFTETARGLVARVLETFGRVPFFYYVLHIPLIHLSAVVVSLIRTGAVSPWLFGNHPMEPPPLPPGYQWSLPLLYLDFVIVLVPLYYACRWFAGVKRRSANPLLQYL